MIDCISLDWILFYFIEHHCYQYQNATAKDGLSAFLITGLQQFEHLFYQLDILMALKLSVMSFFGSSFKLPQPGKIPISCNSYNASPSYKSSKLFITSYYPPSSEIWWAIIFFFSFSFFLFFFFSFFSPCHTRLDTFGWIWLKSMFPVLWGDDRLHSLDQIVF